jgi:GNAT superfamily N-acetyltransferase
VSEVDIRALGEPGDLGWVVMAHGELYWRELGWNTEFEALVARIVAEYARGHDPAREAAWIATMNGQRAGCVFLVAKDDQTAQLRILLVHPDARGRGVGTRLVAKCIRFAREAGYRRIVLWTNEPLTAARDIYIAAGFRLTAEHAHQSFGADLLGQDYELELGPTLGTTMTASCSPTALQSNATSASTHPVNGC